MAIVIPRNLGRQFIDSMMIDRCKITRNVSGVFDAVLDEDTGLLVEPEAEQAVYEGKCLISRVLTKDKEFYEADMPMYANGYKMLVPSSMVDGALGDWVEVLASANDPRAVGRRFRITDIEVGTHPTYRRIMITSTEDNLGSLKGME